MTEASLSWARKKQTIRRSCIFLLWGSWRQDCERHTLKGRSVGAVAGMCHDPLSSCVRTLRPQVTALFGSGGPLGGRRYVLAEGSWSLGKDLEISIAQLLSSFDDRDNGTRATCFCYRTLPSCVPSDCKPRQSLPPASASNAAVLLCLHHRAQQDSILEDAGHKVANK